MSSQDYSNRVFFELFPWWDNQINKIADVLYNKFSDKLTRQDCIHIYKLFKTYISKVYNVKSENLIDNINHLLWYVFNNLGKCLSKQDCYSLIEYMMRNDVFIKSFMINIWFYNIFEDDIWDKKTWADYGLSIDNPMKTAWNIYSKIFLDKLLGVHWEKLKFVKIGVKSNSNLWESKVLRLLNYKNWVKQDENRMVDIYKVFDDNLEEITTLYICPFYKKNLNIVPKGFIFKWWSFWLSVSELVHETDDVFLHWDGDSSQYPNNDIHLVSINSKELDVCKWDTTINNLKWRDAKWITPRKFIKIWLIIIFVIPWIFLVFFNEKYKNIALNSFLVNLPIIGIPFLLLTIWAIIANRHNKSGSPNKNNEKWAINVENIVNKKMKKYRIINMGFISSIIISIWWYVLYNRDFYLILQDKWLNTIGILFTPLFWLILLPICLIPIYWFYMKNRTLSVVSTIMVLFGMLWCIYIYHIYEIDYMVWVISIIVYIVLLIVYIISTVFVFIYNKVNWKCLMWKFGVFILCWLSFLILSLIYLYLSWLLMNFFGIGT